MRLLSILGDEEGVCWEKWRVFRGFEGVLGGGGGGLEVAVLRVLGRRRWPGN